MIVLPTLESGHQTIDVQITSNYSFSLEGGHETPNGSEWFVWIVFAFQIMIDCEAPTPSNATLKTKRPRIYPLDPSMVGGGVLYSRHVSPRSDGGCKQEMVDAPIDGAGSIVQSLQIPRIWNYFGLFILFLLEESKIIQVWDNYNRLSSIIICIIIMDNYE